MIKMLMDTFEYVFLKQLQYDYNSNIIYMYYNDNVHESGVYMYVCMSCFNLYCKNSIQENILSIVTNGIISIYLPNLRS